MPSLVTITWSVQTNYFRHARVTDLFVGLTPIAFNQCHEEIIGCAGESFYNSVNINLPRIIDLVGN